MKNSSMDAVKVGKTNYCTVAEKQTWVGNCKIENSWSA